MALQPPVASHQRGFHSGAAGLPGALLLAALASAAAATGSGRSRLVSGLLTPELGPGAHRCQQLWLLGPVGHRLQGRGAGLSCSWQVGSSQTHGPLHWQAGSQH